jgi:cellulose synthase/poly-beta-1,6-N-acetylglucosamine synthase-like glycosyltransferase
MILMGALYFSASFYCVASLIILGRQRYNNLNTTYWGVLWLVAALIASAISLYTTQDTYSTLSAATGALVFAAVAKSLIPSVNAWGIGYLACKFSLPLAILITCTAAIQHSNLSRPILLLYVLLLAAFLITLFYILCTLIADLPKYSIRYPRLQASLATISLTHDAFNPKISIHVPCYAEPPELVIETLEAISRLNYPDFEVLVIDNNTKNPDLWKPVQDHCETLGPQFRFFHVDPLPGAKSGALNFALLHTAADAALITVIDADYLVLPDYLSRFTPLFKDERTGFVQTSHDYRDWETNPLLSGVYHHYVSPHKTVHPALNEYGTAYLVGTVCIIRRSLLDDLGGWAEWSLTEDLELSMRIMAAGYTGHVFSETWGRGLIPETMTGIKKQQFRWWAGPNQELKKHWRRYFGLVPGAKLTTAQRSLRFYAFIKDCMQTCRFVAEFTLPLLCLYLIMNQQTLYVPYGILFLLLAINLQKNTQVWIEVKDLRAGNVRDYLMTLSIKRALRWTNVLAFVLPLLGVKMAWVRTNKFKQRSNLIIHLYSSSTETLIAVYYLTWAVVVSRFGYFKNLDFLALASIVLMINGLSFLTTLLMSIIGDRYLEKATKNS